MPVPAWHVTLALLLLGTSAAALAGPRHHDEDDDDDRRTKSAVHRPASPPKPTPAKRDEDDDDSPRTAPVAPASAPVAKAEADDDDERAQAAAPLAGALPGPPKAADEEDDDDEDERGPDSSRAIVVTGRRLDAASEGFDRALGASVTTLPNSAVEQRPGGEFGTLGQVLQQFPGTSSGPAGRLSVRGRPAATELRINNAIVPGGGELIERLSTRLAGNTRLIRGALPAQFGPGAAAVLAVRPKTGHELAGGQAEVQLGTAGIVEPAAEWAGSTDRTSLFVTGSASRSRIGLPGIEPRAVRDHDRTRQWNGFGYAEQLLGPDTRLTLMAGADDQRFDLPNPRALAALRLDGRSGDREQFGVASLQHAAGTVQLQATLSRRWRREFDRPDARLAVVTGAPVQQLDGRGVATSLQLEAGWAAAPTHQLRAGLLLSGGHDRERAETTRPGGVVSTASATERRLSRGGFVSDEWQASEALTVTAGLRFDRLRGRGDFWQPRIGASLALGDDLSVYAGFARTLLPAEGASAGVAALAGGPVADPPVERDETVDTGLSWRRGGLSVELSAYRTALRHPLDQALLAGRPTPVPFAFARGRSEGIELALTYNRRGWSAWGNASLGRGWGEGLATGSALFSIAERQAIAAGHVPLSAVRPWLVSGGVIRRLGPVALSAQLVRQSGLPSAGGGRPAPRLPASTRIDAAANWRLRGLGGKGVDLRLELANLTGSRRQLTPGLGLVPAPGYATGRTLSLIAEQSF